MDNGYANTPAVAQIKKDGIASCPFAYGLERELIILKTSIGSVCSKNNEEATSLGKYCKKQLLVGGTFSVSLYRPW